MKLNDHFIKYKTMLSYCLKRKKITENTNPVVSKLYAVLENQNLLKNKKQKDY